VLTFHHRSEISVRASREPVGDGTLGTSVGNEDSKDARCHHIKHII